MNVQEQVHQLLAPVVATLQVELCDVEYSGSTLRVFVEEAAGEAQGAGRAITTDRLAEVNRLISPILDQHDPVPGRYTLEVSSPGLERPLRRPSQFRRAVGEEIVVKMVSSVAPRRYKGRLLSIDPLPAGGLVAEGVAPGVESWAEPAIGGTLALAGSLTLEASEVDGVPLHEAERRVLDLIDVATARTVFAWGPGPKPGQARKQPATGAGARPRKAPSSGAAPPPASPVPDNPPTEVCDEQ